MKSIFEYAKTIFFLLILLQIAPPLLRNIKESYLGFLTVQTKVGRITFNEIINDSTFYAKSLKKFFKDQEIKAILLKIDSPGGASGSCQALFNEVQELKKRYPKPVIALIENSCLSGAYYIACATDHIIATRSALIGGVGATFPTFFNFKELAKQWNIQTHVVSSGAYKATTNQFQESTPEQWAMLQKLADNSYQQFATDVAKTRKLSFKDKEQWAEGRIFTGQQAYELHMIDQTGSYSQALIKIKSMAPVEGSIEWVDPYEPLSFFERFFGGSVPTLKSATNHICSVLEERYATQT